MKMSPKRYAAAAIVASLILAACGGDDDGAEPPAEEPATEEPATEEPPAEEPPAEEPGAEEPPAEEPPAEEPPAELSGTLTGAGATFPNPVFQDWAFFYQQDVQPGVSLNYQGIGSGGGIEQFLLQTVDFGSSERYLRDDALEEAADGRGCPAIQFPVLFGAVTIAFGDDQFDGLVLDAETIADIFQRNITKYNDPKIAALNPDRDLPDLDIIPVHRSDGSGTTSVFTTYLEWAAGDGTDGDGGESRFGPGQEAQNWALGSGTEVQWPADTIGGQGNEGVTAGIEQNPGGLGYVNQAYALINQLPTAAVINSDGNAVQATLDATTEALEVLEVPESFQFDILGVGGGGFPIAGANWIFTYECGYDDNVGAMLIDYWTWATQSEQAIELARELGYAPLGEGLRGRVLEAIERTNSAN